MNKKVWVVLACTVVTAEAFLSARKLGGGKRGISSTSSTTVTNAAKKVLKKGSKNNSNRAAGFGAKSKAVTKTAPVGGKVATTSEVFSIKEVPLEEGVSCDKGSQGPEVPLNTLFMGAYMIEDERVCDDLNALFDRNPEAHRRGVIGRDGKPVVDTEKKDSFEMSFLPDDPSPEWARYVTALQQCTMPYCTKYEYAANYVGAWGLSSPTNLQHYPPGGGYKTFHTERRDRTEPGASRHLVFMTYLTDVEDAGGTEFYHQNCVIRPRKGLTLIWPADWTFMHRGIASPTQEKRIMTGWFNFS